MSSDQLYPSYINLAQIDMKNFPPLHHPTPTRPHHSSAPATPYGQRAQYFSSPSTDAAPPPPSISHNYRHQWRAEDDGNLSGDESDGDPPFFGSTYPASTMPSSPEIALADQVPSIARGLKRSASSSTWASVGAPSEIFSVEEEYETVETTTADTSQRVSKATTPFEEMEPSASHVVVAVKEEDDAEVAASQQAAWAAPVMPKARGRMSKATLRPPPAPRRGSEPAPLMFIVKLKRLLGDPKYQDQIRWNPEGTAFIIWHKDPVWHNEILPAYWGHRNYASFTRQLNVYVFQRLDSTALFALAQSSELRNGLKGDKKPCQAWYHASFVRHDDQAAESMRPRAPARTMEHETVQVRRRSKKSKKMKRGFNSSDESDPEY